MGRMPCTLETRQASVHIVSSDSHFCTFWVNFVNNKSFASKSKILKLLPAVLFFFAIFEILSMHGYNAVQV